MSLDCGRKPLYKDRSPHRKGFILKPEQSQTGSKTQDLLGSWGSGTRELYLQTTTIFQSCYNASHETTLVISCMSEWICLYFSVCAHQSFWDRFYHLMMVNYLNISLVDWDILLTTNTSEAVCTAWLIINWKVHKNLSVDGSVRKETGRLWRRVRGMKEVVLKEDEREKGKRRSYGKEGKVSGRHLWESR